MKELTKRNFKKVSSKDGCQWCGAITHVMEECNCSDICEFFGKDPVTVGDIIKTRKLAFEAGQKNPIPPLDLKGVSIRDFEKRIREQAKTDRDKEWIKAIEKIIGETDEELRTHCKVCSIIATECKFCYSKMKLLEILKKLKAKGETSE
jgi:hypothetical protein